MSTTKIEHMKTAHLPQNGDTEANAVIDKPVEESSAAIEPHQVEIIGAAKQNAVDDKLDEFARLELELADLNKSGSVLDDDDKLNTLTPVNVAIDKNVNEEKLEESEKYTSENNLLINTNVNQNGKISEQMTDLLQTYKDLETEMLDHEDLIAVLKGETPSQDKNKPLDTAVNNEIEQPCTSKSQNIAKTSNELFVEGVTIEGEGEYQIMEVVDDLEDESESNVVAAVQPNLTAQQSPNSKSSPTQKLTREEERAMAMEQIANLARPPRRRKQDIKPLPFETSELVSTIGADWSDDSDDADIGSAQPRASISKNAANAAAKTQKTNAKKEIVAVQQAQNASEIVGAGATTSAIGRKRRRSSGANVTSVIVLPAQQNSTVPNTETVSVASAEKDAPINQITTGAATGFKRTRTIKRRIIWDPDAPETAFSYANLVRGKSKERHLLHSSSSITATKPLTEMPKDKRLTTETVSVVEKKTGKRSSTPSKQNVSGAVLKPKNTETPSTSKQSARSQTVSPVANGGQSEIRKKKVSEIDRLMGDEGAASMLSSLESERGRFGEESGDDKPHKPMMRSRAIPVEKAIKREGTPVAAPPAANPSKKPRLPKAKASTSWDYVYQKKQQLSDDSMIIRRRSNSSYSSNASQHRLSIDGPIGTGKTNINKNMETSPEDDDATVPAIARTTKQNQKHASKVIRSDNCSPSSKRASPAGSSKSFEFIKPKEAKGSQKTSNRNVANSVNVDTTLNADMKKTTTKRGRPSAANKNKEPVPISGTSPTNDPNGTEVSDVVVRKGAKMAQIIFNTHRSKLSGTFSPQLMNKIVDTLDNLATDASCNTVAFITNTSDFCRGIDFSGLVTGSVEQRKAAATLLATSTKNFLKALATFPKPLVAGIHGSISGLGVTQLPLFDVVISSDKATLETPYIKIGQTPEGYCIWQSLWNIRANAKTKLFWLAEKLQSTEAASVGLVTKLTTTDKVNDDAISTAKKMANMSVEAYRKIKIATIQSRLDAIKSPLDNEFDEITKQWTSTECCTKFKKYIESGHF